MDWSEVGKKIGKFAPLLGGVLGGSPGQALGSIVAEALGSENTPQGVSAALVGNPEAQAILLKLQEENKHQYKLILIELEKTAITQQALTARKELESDDTYVRRWRPTFGYSLCFSFTVFSLAFCWILIEIVKDPAAMAVTVRAIADLMGPVSLIWSLALAVLGINVRERSKDKQVKAGMAPKSFFDVFKRAPTN